MVLDVAANEAPSSALGEQVDIQFALGFSDVFRLGRWTPLTVTVSNRGQDLLGWLEVATQSGDALQGNLFGAVHQRALELPNGTRKRFRFTVLLDNSSAPLIIRVRSANGDLAQRTIDLRGRSSTARLILVLSRDADLDYLNAKRRKSSEEALRVLYPHPELLPDHWQGYDGVEALVMHGLALEQLSARQFESLRKWLSRGGILAVSGGPDYALLRTPRLAELLPGVPIGITQISAGASEGLPESFPKSFNIHRLARFQGQARYQAGDLPLIIEQNRGQGRVLYLTFDIARAPFSDWPGMTRLWLDSLRLPPPRTVPAQSESLVPAVIRKSPEEFPQAISVLVFLVLYLGVLATGYRLAANANTRKFSWPTWATPLLFAPLAYLLFGLFPKGAAVVILSTIEPFPHSPYARLQLDLGMYSNQKSDLRFEYQGAEPVFQTARLNPPQAENWVFGVSARHFLRPENQREYVLHRLAGQDIIHYDLNGSVAETNTGFELRLQNASGRTLNKAWLIIEDSAYPLGAIPADAQLQRDFTIDKDAFERNKVLWHKALAPTHHATKTMLIRTLKTLSSERGAWLLGFTPSPLRVSGATHSWQRIELALVIAQLPLTRLVTEQTGP